MAQFPPNVQGAGDPLGYNHYLSWGPAEWNYSFGNQLGGGGNDPTYYNDVFGLYPEQAQPIMPNTGFAQSINIGSHSQQQNVISQVGENSLPLPSAVGSTPDLREPTALSSFVRPVTWTETKDLFLDWALGRGPEVRVFGPNTNQVRDLMDAPGVNAAREFFYQKNAGRGAQGLLPVENFTSRFGLTGLWRGGFDPTEQFVGSYRVDIYPRSEGTIQFLVTNTTSATSFFYGVVPSWNRSTLGPGGNMTQIYTWTESVRR